MTFVASYAPQVAGANVKTIGNLLIALGWILFGVIAVMRRILTPEDRANISTSVNVVLVGFVVAVVFMVAGHLVRKLALRPPGDTFGE